MAILHSPVGEFHALPLRSSGRLYFAVSARILLLIAVLISINVGVGASAQVLLDEKFDDLAIGPYTVPIYESQFPNSVFHQGLWNGRGATVAGSYGLDSTTLRVTYPKNTVGPAANGLQFMTSFPGGQSYDDATVSYTLVFEPGMDFGRGGKLPGLTGNRGKASGGTPANGFNGWSSRVMFSGAGGLYQYVYHVDQPTQFGDRFDWIDEQGDPVILETGRPYQLKTQVVMNDPLLANGRIRSWLDGELVLDRDGMRFRLDDQYAVGEFYFSTFHGGATPDWAPDVNSFAQFDNLHVATGIGAGPGDFNADGTVSQGDLNLVLTNWGVDSIVAGNPAGWVRSVDLVGSVDQSELNLVLMNWGASQSPGQIDKLLPEPASVGLLAVIWGISRCVRPCGPSEPSRRRRKYLPIAGQIALTEVQEDRKMST
ncbi:MAG: polysaccharide lyase [Planctomycetota bacterium]